MEPTRVAVRAPAKVNLALAVGPLRPDGYHPLATVFHALSLYEEVVATLADDVVVTAEGPGADLVPLDERNLAVQAARALATYAGVDEGVHLHLRKGVPVAGGMAGGSADAAAALVACDALWRTGLGRNELETLAARLGSDVPFALHGGTAVGTGRGERLTPALVSGTYHWVVAVADGGLSTPEVYGELDRMREQAADAPGCPEVPPRLLAALRAGDAEALGQALANDLQDAACRLRPGLRDTLEEGRGLGALGALVSGSGPSCVFLARDEDHAEDLSLGLAAAEVCREVQQATGPVPGARLVAA
ncbi:MAG TPA: 4-(cytidine 5'-diphospho)-2-C-methyl-D-erythritol kinase [Jiangellales bacterium]|nr:4-(cytidine 5'-diphospho)-2-C-methyl-D-erythritol kinase [Jiangellales bacterium]